MGSRSITKHLFWRHVGRSIYLGSCVRQVRQKLYLLHVIFFTFVSSIIFLQSFKSCKMLYIIKIYNDCVILYGGGWMFIHFLIVESILFFVYIEFHCIFSTSYRITILRLFIIVFWLSSDRPSGLPFLSCPLYFFFILAPLFLHSSSVLFKFSHARVFGKALVHEFHISYCDTEWYLFFSDSRTTSAQYVFGKSRNTITSKPEPLN